MVRRGTNAASYYFHPGRVLAAVHNNRSDQTARLDHRSSILAGFPSCRSLGCCLSWPNHGSCYPSWQNLLAVILHGPCFPSWSNHGSCYPSWPNHGPCYPSWLKHNRVIHHDLITGRVIHHNLIMGRVSHHDLIMGRVIHHDLIMGTLSIMT